jgi:hypothetical protein
MYQLSACCAVQLLSPLMLCSSVPLELLLEVCSHIKTVLFKLCRMTINSPGRTVCFLPWLRAYARAMDQLADVVQRMWIVNCIGHGTVV